MRNRTFMHIVRDDSVLGTLKFVTKSEDNQVYGALILSLMINQKIQNSNSYKTYLEFATGATTPKKARKWKKPASLSKKQTLLITEEPAKKPAARKQPTNIQIKDTPGVSVSKKKAPAKGERNKGINFLFEAALLEETHMKKAIKRIKWETYMYQAGGSGDRAGFQPEVLDEQKGKSIDTHEGTGLKPGVFDVSKANFSDSEYESWGVSDDDDDDDQQGDDERTESDDDKSVDLNKIDDEEETQEDEFFHTLDDYIPKYDETHDVDDEEYDRINKEMYDDVNVELKDVELVNKGKGGDEMTDADNVELEEVNQEVASAQVQDEAQATTTVAPTQVTSSSRSVSSNYGSIFLNLDNISSVETEIISMLDVQVQHENTIPESETLSAIHLRVSDLEKEVQELKQVDHSTTLLATIKSKVPTAVNEYLGTSLGDALHKVLQRHTVELIKEHSVPADVVEVLKQQQKPQKSVVVIRKIKMEQASKQQETKYTITSSDKATLKEFD
ncbi:hypothetical protein Tco_1533736 [Tanacetum coccineum]